MLETLAGKIAAHTLCEAESNILIDLVDTSCWISFNCLQHLRYGRLHQLRIATDPTDVLFYRGNLLQSVLPINHLCNGRNEGFLCLAGITTERDMSIFLPSSSSGVVTSLSSELSSIRFGNMTSICACVMAESA